MNPYQTQQNVTVRMHIWCHRNLTPSGIRYESLFRQPGEFRKDWGGPFPADTTDGADVLDALFVNYLGA